MALAIHICAIVTPQTLLGAIHIDGHRDVEIAKNIALYCIRTCVWSDENQDKTISENTLTRNNEYDD